MGLVCIHVILPIRVTATKKYDSDVTIFFNDKFLPFKTKKNCKQKYIKYNYII